MASPKGGEQESLPCAFQRGSLALETFIVLPFLLCAVTAMLYVFVMTGFQAEKYRTLTQQAQSLAVTVGQGADEGDPYTRLYAYDQVDTSVYRISFLLEAASAYCSV